MRNPLRFAPLLALAASLGAAVAAPTPAPPTAAAAGPESWFAAGGWLLEGEPIQFRQEEGGALVLDLPAGGSITFAGGVVSAHRISGRWDPASEDFSAQAEGEVSYTRESEEVHSHRLALGADGFRFSGAVDGTFGAVRMVGDALTVTADMARFSLEEGRIDGAGFTLQARTLSGTLDQTDLSAEGRVVLQADTGWGESLLCLSDHLTYNAASGALEAWPAQISLGGGTTLAADRVLISPGAGTMRAEGEFRLEMPTADDAG